MRRLKTVEELHEIARKRRRGKKVARKKGPRVDYGRRVRSEYHPELGRVVVPVRPHAGLKPKS